MAGAAEVEDGEEAMEEVVRLRVDGRGRGADDLVIAVAVRRLGKA